ncbi:MAG TPA: hypothetical protein VD902_12020, partial [Symbiobacteriaceae bacterium]|nr:hypothetical protein [Symbiobacteriaceae bacterium]
RRILVRPDQLQALSGSMRQSAAQVNAMTHRLAGGFAGLDWEAHDKARVEAAVDSARSQARTLAGQAEGMAEFLKTRAELFVAADQRGIDPLGVPWSASGAPPGWVAQPWGGPSAEAAPSIIGGGWIGSQFPGLFGPEAPAGEVETPAGGPGTPAYIPQYDGTEPAPGTTNTAAGNPVEPPLTGFADNRSAALYDDIINQFAVGTNPRYAKRDLNQDGRIDTFCNIFVWDVTSAMGAEIPHKVGDDELDANETCDWLANQGPANGWRAVFAEEAQAFANEGLPVVAAWDSGGRGAGHVAIVRPGEYDQAAGPRIAQAGGTNFNDGTVAVGFGKSSMADVKYYVHP